MFFKKVFLVTYFVFAAFSINCFAKDVKKNSNFKNDGYKHFGIIISGPSGVGKTTIVEKLSKKHPELSISVSVTTRQKRNGEVDGKSYHFLDKKKFKQLLNNNEFIEYAKNYGNYYGSLKKSYTNAIKNGKDVVFVLSTDGAKNALKNKNMDFVTIFISATSDDVLMKRLKYRNTESTKQINKRYKQAKKEMSCAKKYDYVVYNDNLKKAVENIEAIYLTEKRKRKTN